MREWFHRLKVAHKLMLISIFFIMPDSVMLYLFITGINANIQFARMEQKGNAYQRPLEALLELIPQHRHLAQHLRDGEASIFNELAKKEGEIEAAFDELEAVDARIGADLQFTDEGLAKRKREHYRARTVRGEWVDLRDHLATVQAEDSAARHLHLVADLRTMITHAGDLSNLILDPDLDSYYLMDATLLALPQTQDRLAAVMAHGETVLRQPVITRQERQQFAIYAQMLRESDLDRIVGSVQTSLNEDRNFYGTSETLQERVPPALKDFLAAASTFIELTAQLVNEEAGDVTAESYFTAGRTARDASFKLWTVADAEVDTLLQRRIEAYQARRAKSLAVAACALLAAIGFVTFITRSISGPLRQQATALQTANQTLQAEISERNRAEAELRRSEAQLAAAQKIARMGSWEWDIMAGKMNWSEENYRIHGYEPRELEASYEAALGFVPAAERGFSDTAFRKALREKRPFSFVQHIIRRDGQERIIHQRGDVVLAVDGSVAKMFGTAQDITERKRAEEELERMHKNLLEVSRQAGMAEVATGVLHNVGNVLNSVNVSALLISERLSKSRVGHLSNVSTLLRENASDLAGFFTIHPKGKALPGFINSLADRLGVEQAELLREVEGLARNIAHIKDIVAVQQDYAKVSGVIESLSAESLVEDALEMNGAAFVRHHVELVREFTTVPPVRVDKHKVLQILINLVRNAKYAVSESRQREKRITVQVCPGGGDRVRIVIADNGIGIAPENLSRIFEHGFTTKKDGHGFGLHSSALAAREIGGALIAHSEGPGRGATFTLDLPSDRDAADLPPVL